MGQRQKKRPDRFSSYDPETRLSFASGRNAIARPIRELTRDECRSEPCLETIGGL